MPPTTLDVIRERPDVIGEITDRLRETADRRKGDDDANAVRTEVLLKHRLALGDRTMMPHQFELAMDQHACRTHREAPNACDSVVFYGKPCGNACPVAQERVRREAARDQERTRLRIANDVFVTDWYMPEAHQLLLDQEG